MALKPRYKRRILWTVISIIAAAALCLVFIPPMITLNKLKPRLESAILQQTGVPAQILGDVRFSLLGGATIIARDISTPTGRVGGAMFTVPWRAMFDLSSAPIGDTITVFGAHVVVNNLAPQDFSHDINIENSTVTFMGKDYEIIRGQIVDNRFRGTVRTNQHKYDIEFFEDQFQVKNRNNNLDITGRLFSDGTARGEMSIKTDDINKWFEFEEPKIKGTVDLTMDFAWDGEYGFEFTNIRADNFIGEIKLFPDGGRNIKIRSRDMDFDFSFLLDPTRVFFETALDLDLYGRLRFADRVFSHLRIKATGSKSRLQIANIVADDIAITGGNIDADGAHEIMINMPMDGVDTSCLFSGTPENWTCSQFSYGNIWGDVTVASNTVRATVQSDDPMPGGEMKKLIALAPNGTIDFNFSDAAGTVTIKNGKASISYDRATNKTVKWTKMNARLIPDELLDDVGDFERSGDAMRFTPHSGRWMLITDGGKFQIYGQKFKDWFPGMDLPFMRDFPFTITGQFDGDTISDITLRIADHEFTGVAAGNHITLHTDSLNIDTFTSQSFIDNYEELEFLTAHPLMAPFGINVQVSLSADKLIYNGTEYENFVYSLKPSIQTFSISDNARGNLLAQIKRSGATYAISIQLNKFAMNGMLLSAAMPLNVRDANVTADINMTTSGTIAHDISYNMAGTLDMTFTGGYLIGLGIDGFYASAPQITKLNAEYALAAAFEEGETALKKLHIIGKYENGDFETTAPLELSMRHTDGIGALVIADGQMTAALQLTMRGTAPTPANIDVRINPDGGRVYSTTQIMRDLDPAFMRAFIQTHDKY